MQQEATASLLTLSIWQLRMLRVRASQARTAYVASPSSQQALDELRHTEAAFWRHCQQAATDAMRAGVLSMAISPPTTSTICTSSGSNLQSSVTCSGNMTPR